MKLVTVLSAFFLVAAGPLAKPSGAGIAKDATAVTGLPAPAAPPAAEPAPEMAPPVVVPVLPVAADDPISVVANVVTAVRAGQWRLAASALLILVMVALTKFRSQVKWFAGDRGGAVLAGVLAGSGAFSSALATSVPLDWRLLLGTFSVLWTAVGGYTWFRRILWPKDSPESHVKLPRALTGKTEEKPATSEAAAPAEAADGQK